MAKPLQRIRHDSSSWRKSSGDKLHPERLLCRASPPSGDGVNAPWRTSVCMLQWLLVNAEHAGAVERPQAPSSPRPHDSDEGFGCRGRGSV